MKPTQAMIDGEIARQAAKAAAAERRALGRTPLLYALRLVGERYYVGRTNDAIVRVERHMQGKGAQWTQLFAPVGLIECKPCTSSDPRDADQQETLWTLQYMRRYGWRHVRGGYFCNVDEAQTEKALRAHGVFELLQERDPRSR